MPTVSEKNLETEFERNLEYDDDSSRMIIKRLQRQLLISIRNRQECVLK